MFTPFTSDMEEVETDFALCPNCCARDFREIEKFKVQGHEIRLAHCLGCDAPVAVMNDGERVMVFDHVEDVMMSLFYLKKHIPTRWWDQAFARVYGLPAKQSSAIHDHLNKMHIPKPICLRWMEKAMERGDLLGKYKEGDE